MQMQGVSEIEDAESGLDIVSIKPKNQKWKLQARKVDSKNDLREGSIKTERTASELNLESLK